MSRTTGWIVGLALLSGTGAWQSRQATLASRWSAQVSAEHPHPEYPRPQMVRAEWLNLNGRWDYAIRLKEEERPESFEGRILVPFPVESSLSGVQKSVGPEQRLWYRRRLEIPASWMQRRILLHFGAVDWETMVWVNGHFVGEHRGGYDAFSFDITSALERSGSQEILLAVWDPTDAGYQPRGKQVRNPRGIWYTPTTGIWQTVWLEPVPTVSIERVKIVPDIRAGAFNVTVHTRGSASDHRVRVSVRDGANAPGQASGAPGRPVVVKVPSPRMWSPDSPFLYDMDVELMKGDAVVDRVTGYAGLRRISVCSDAGGRLRLCLNDKPVFQFGPLDQGFWPDGLYAAPTDEALRYDIEVTRSLGFNMARKHVKIEPERWYYWCDRLGLLVWQDMPSGDRSIGKDAADIQRVAQSARQFELELQRAIDRLHNHPCIVMWVPFNEGWGQYDTARIAEWIKAYDPTRLVDSASGWADRGAGDVRDVHSYPGPEAPPLEDRRAAVLGEFGGLGLPVSGHTWQAEKNWGYRSFKTREELTEAYLQLIDKLVPLIEGGLAAAVYTQTTDVEIEVNGLMTYDRAMIKMDAGRISAANRRVYGAIPPAQASLKR